MVHRGGGGHRAGVEGLHLIGAKTVFLEPNRQVQHVLIAGARMRGNKVRNQELLLPDFGAELVK